MSRIQTEDKGLVLQVEGTLSGPSVRTLQVECEQAAERGLITLDLLGVTFLDREGAKLLVALDRDHGVKLTNLSPFVRQVLGRNTP